jgi:peptidoglycan/xylan/chitin deacetylase (PgdA/CDA1 family)
MTTSLRSLLMAGGARLPVPSSLTPTRPVVLTYHGVSRRPDLRGFSAAVFEQHIAFLKQNFALVAPPTVEQPQVRVGTPPEVLLTFDDGFRNHAECVVPILRRHRVPAIFFVPTRHATAGRYLWFVYMRMLERHFPGDDFTFRGQLVDMSLGRRRASMARLGSQLLGLTPHPTAMYAAIDELPTLEDFLDRSTLEDEAAGMTEEQVEEVAADPLFVVGAHSEDHPFLPRCPPDEQRRQILANKQWIERTTRRVCDTIAYPASEYDESVVQVCREAGFVSGYGGEHSRGVGRSLEISRIGVYYPSIRELGVKVWWSQAISYWHGGRPWSGGDSMASAVEGGHA